MAMISIEGEGVNSSAGQFHDKGVKRITLLVPLTQATPRLQTAGSCGIGKKNAKSLHILMYY
jgi:hypothetical protein